MQFLWRRSVITHIELSNFKSWERTGPIDFAPVTAFFGGNSSGKTSLLQSLLLLKQTTDSADRGRVFDLGGPASLVSLGNFQDIVFDHDQDRSVNIEISWREDSPFAIRDPAQGKNSVVTSSPDLRLAVDVFSQRATPVVRTVTYGVGDLVFWMQRKKDDKDEYDLGSNSYKFRRVTGRAWPLPPPAKFYGFPDQVRAYYQNASFLSDLELQFEKLCGKIHYLGPLRQDPERQYVWSGGRPVDVGRRGELAVDALISSQADGPVNSRGFVETRRGIRRTSRISVEQHVAEWLKQLGLIHQFSVEAVDDRQTLYRVHVQQTRHSTPVLLTDVGFGVSQVLPVLVLLAYVPEGSTVLLEQPEIHLHPSVQSGLADILIEAALVRNVQVIVESHSEHLLMRLQRRIAEKSLAHEIVVSPDHFSLYFCETREGRSSLERLKVDRFGVISNWPQDFFGDPFTEAAETAKAARVRAARERST
jgi:predicted ATPase